MYISVGQVCEQHALWYPHVADFHKYSVVVFFNGLFHSIPLCTMVSVKVRCQDTILYMYGTLAFNMGTWLDSRAKVNVWQRKSILILEFPLTH